MAAPTVVTQTATAFNTTAPKTVTLASATAGDYIVVLGLTEDSSVNLAVPTATGTTFTPQAAAGTSGYGNAYIWVAPVTTTGSTTVTVTRSGGTGSFGADVLLVRGAAGIGNAAQAVVTNTAPSLAITTTAPNSLLVYGFVDWTATDGSSRVWRTTAGATTEDAYALVSGAATFYAGRTPNAGAAGAKAVGLSAPAGQTSTQVAIELQGSASAPIPVAEYGFEEGSGSIAADSSGNSHDATLNGGVTWVAGKNGGAVAFDGSSGYGAAPDTADLELTTGMTIMAWVRPTKAATAYLVKKAWSSVADGYELSLSSTGKAFARLNQATSANTYQAMSTSSYPTNGTTWVHLAATYDGTSLLLYVNGTLEKTVAGPAAIAVNSAPLGLGAEPDGSTGRFAGALDDVRVYNTALSAADITTAMNTPVGAVSSSAQVNAVVATASTSAIAPSVSGLRAATVAAVVATASVLALAPSVSSALSGNVQAVVATVNTSAQNPSVQIISGVDIAASVATIDVSAVSPSVTTGVSSTVVAVVASTTRVDAVGPDVTTSTFVSGGGPADITVAAVPPVISTGAAVSVPIAQVSATAIPPSVVADGMTTVGATTATVMVAAVPPSVVADRTATVGATTATVAIAAQIPSVSISSGQTILGIWNGEVIIDVETLGIVTATGTIEQVEILGAWDGNVIR